MKAVHAPDESCQAVGLLCEEFENPMGIGERRPHLSWRFVQGGRNRSQSAWQLIAASDSRTLAAGHGDLWDSGVVCSGATRAIWQGKPLSSMQAVHWKARLRDNDSNWGEWSDPASFQMGILDPSEWTASWIGGFPRLRRSFEIDGALEDAVAIVSGIGMYELRLNGAKVGDRELAPTHTECLKRIEYAAWNVRKLLQNGENAISFMLAPGWLKLRFNNPKAPLALLQLYIKSDGAWRLALKTDASWKGSPESPVLASCLYDGESYDARLEDRGWDCPNFNDSEWSEAVVDNAAWPTPSAQMAPAIKVVQTLPPQTLTHPKPGICVVDFGQNFSGFCRLNLADAPAGHRISLKFAETLNPDGSVNQLNLRGGKSEDVYLTKEGRQSWMPRFTYHGFRYVQVEGWPGEMSHGSIEGMHLRSSVKRTGRFACSDEFLNRIYQAMVWTQSSNLHDKPTDCCQRDERVGWMGGGQFGMLACIYNFDVWGFYRKWLQDIAEEQDPASGAIRRAQGPGWASGIGMPMYYAFFGVAWKLWRYYGDLDSAARNYGGLKKLHAFLEAKAQGSLLFLGHNYGDWLAIEHTPPEQVDNVFWFHSTQIMAELAAALGHCDDAMRYSSMAAEIRDAYNKRWYHAETGFYGLDDRLTQAANAMPYVFGISSASESGKIIGNLLWNVCDSRGSVQLAGGYSSMQHLLEALDISGNWNVALQALRRKDYPGWGFMLEKGATTLWERWEYMCGREMNSHNQFAQAASAPFLYHVAAGMRWPLEEGGRRVFRFAPRFPKSLDWAEASLDTPWGAASIKWSRAGRRIELELVIPANCLARLEAPAASNAELLGSGSWSFELEDGE